MTENEIVAEYARQYPSLNIDTMEIFQRSAAFQTALMKKLDLPAGTFTHEEIMRPVQPFFLDLEITTACQLRCCYCARTFLGIAPKHMSLQLFTHILNKVPEIIGINLVGLGEPLLHPELDRIIMLLKNRNIRTALVTNGMALNRKKTELLIDCGLDSITFSLDNIEPKFFQRYRTGANLKVIMDNIRFFQKHQTRRGAEVASSIFTVLQPTTISTLGKLAEFSRSVNIPAIVASDLNFVENSEYAIRSHNNEKDMLEELFIQMRQVAGSGVVLLGPNILDSVNMETDWPYSIISKPEQLLKQEGTERKKCLAPWRTLAVRVDGGVNYCNCMPQTSAGNLAVRTLEDIWWDKDYQQFRNRLYLGPIPFSCQSCPRL